MGRGPEVGPWWAGPRWGMVGGVSWAVDGVAWGGPCGEGAVCNLTVKVTLLV